MTDSTIFDNCAELVAKFKNGDDSAYEQLYANTQKMVYAVCLGILKNEEDAFDAMQETYLTVYRKTGHLDDNKSFISWLKKIATTKSLNLYRKRKGNVSYDDAIAADESLQLDDDLESLPDSYIMEKTKREALDKIIKDSLSDVQYQTIHMHYYSEFSVETIAELMNCPVGTVKTRLMKSRAKIKEGIRKYEKDNKDAFAAAPAVPFLTRFFNASSSDLKVPSINISTLIGDQASNVAPTIVDAVTQIASNDAVKDVAKGGFMTTAAAKIIAGALAVAVPAAAVIGIKSYLDRNKVEETLVVEESESSIATIPETEEVVYTVVETYETTVETEETVESETEETETEMIEGVVIDNLSFPDAAFRDYVLNNIDVDHDGLLTEQEAASVSDITIEYSDLSDLTGISYFTSLESVHLFSCNVASVDMSANPSLTYLRVIGGPLTSVNVRNNPGLTVLNLGDNPISSIDISNNPALQHLEIVNTGISSLDLSNNPALEHLNCNGANLSSLDLSHNPSVDTLYCIGNNLTALDLSHNTQLTSLMCGSNQLNSLDLSNNPQIEYVDCQPNNLTSINLTNCTHLTDLVCGSNQLSSLDTSSCTSLRSLYCGYSRTLTTVNVTGNPALEELICCESGITSLDISGNPALRVIRCEDTSVSSIDIRNSPNLVNAYLNGTRTVGLYWTNYQIDDPYYLLCVNSNAQVIAG